MYKDITVIDNSIHIKPVANQNLVSTSQGWNVTPNLITIATSISNALPNEMFTVTVTETSGTTPAPNHVGGSVTGSDIEVYFRGPNHQPLLVTSYQLKVDVKSNLGRAGSTIINVKHTWTD